MATSVPLPCAAAPDASPTPAPSPRERHFWMDLLRGFAILLVIAFHAVTILKRQQYTAPALLENFNQLFTLYRMPSLVFLSGLLLAGSFRKGVVLYLMGKGRRILWPLLIWSILYSFVIGPRIDGPAQLLKYLSGQSYLWFLTFILIYYLAAVPLKRVPPLAVAGAALILSILAPDGSKNGERLFYLMAFFFLGGWVGTHLQVWLRVIRTRWALLAWLPVATGAVAAVAYDLAYGPLYLIPSLCFVLAVSAAAWRVESRAAFAPLIFIGQNSLIFYVSHFPTIFLVMALCRRLGAPAEVATLVAFPIALAVGLVLTRASKASRAVNLLFVAPAPPQRLVGALQAVERRLAPA